MGWVGGGGWRGRGFWRWVQAKAGQSPVPGSQWGAVSFWEPSSDPLLGTPAGCRDTWSVQDRSICPATSCSRSCQRPYHHLLHRHLMEMTCCRLTDLADTHGSPSTSPSSVAGSFSSFYFTFHQRRVAASKMGGWGRSQTKCKRG